MLFCPYTPQKLPLYLKEDFSPRAVLMLVLVVSTGSYALFYNTH